MRLGRRGDETLSIQFILMMVFAMLFAAFALNYIIDNATNQAYFSEYHAIDLSTLAEISVAGQGDVYVTYDNFRRDFKAKYYLNERMVAIGPTDTNEPYAMEFYGRARKYIGATELTSPLYIIMKKVDRSFLISDNNRPLETCPKIMDPLIPLSDAKVFLDLQGDLLPSEKEKIKEVFSTVFTKISLVSSEDDANVIIRLTIDAGSTNSLRMDPANIHGQSFACSFEEFIKDISLIDFSPLQMRAAGIKEFDVHITITTSNQVSLKPNQIGNALAQALGRYYV